MNMMYVGKSNKQEFDDAVALTFIPLKLNFHPFLLVASPIINDF